MSGTTRLGGYGSEFPSEVGFGGDRSVRRNDCCSSISSVFKELTPVVAIFAAGGAVAALLHGTNPLTGTVVNLIAVAVGTIAFGILRLIGANEWSPSARSIASLTGLVIVPFIAAPLMSSALGYTICHWQFVAQVVTQAGLMEIGERTVG